MCRLRYILFLPLLFIHLSMNGNKFSEYLKGNLHIIFVNELPAHSQNKIIIFSSRYFISDDNYSQKRGVHPAYRLFKFIAAINKDTVYVQPVEDFAVTTANLPDERNFLIYVNGHGKTFSQVLERGFEISSRYPVNLVIFDWPTDYFALRKTVYNANEAAGLFVKSLNEFDVFHNRYFANTEVNVIFHSMGNRIIENVAKNKRLIAAFPPDLIGNMILNAAAVKQANHAKWVERISVQKKIYIVMNREDRTLQGAAILRISKQLGLGSKSRLAENAVYADFSNLQTIDHNLFLGKSLAEINNREIYRFYNNIMQGIVYTPKEKIGQVLNFQPFGI